MSPPFGPWERLDETTFDLRGEHVGKRKVEAIRRAAEEGPITLECLGTTFVAALNLTDLKIVGAADFRGAVFQRGLRLEDVVFECDACFDRAKSTDFVLRDAEFEGDALFRELEVAGLVARHVDFERYASFDGARLGSASFRDVHFAAEARFRKSRSDGKLTFSSVEFSHEASFANCHTGALALANCHFQGSLHSDGLEVAGRVELNAARFDQNRSLRFQAGSTVSLEAATFARSLTLAIETPVLDAAGACFEGGADILLPQEGRASFASAAFLGPSLIATRHSGRTDDRPARLASLDGTRVESLSLQDLDLSECCFARLHHSDCVLITGRGQLARAPAVVDDAYQREVLADEVVRRSGSPRKMLQWAPTQWVLPTALGTRDQSSAQAIADLYRGMRKAREESHDYPGAADFYYGEMEMRREGADNWVERLVLTAYWLVSGYGMRAARAAIFFVLVLALLAAGFQTFGFDDPPSFWHTLAWTMTASISLVRPVEHMDLTTVGMYMNVVSRIVGPALIALVVFALRSRVRR